MKLAESVSEIYHLLDKPKSSQPFLADTAPLAIYGAGNIGKDVYNLLVQRGANIVCFFDKKAQPGDDWHGVPVLQPDSDKFTVGERQQMHVVIGIFNAYVDLVPIMEMLNDYGYGKVTSFLDFYRYFEEELGDRYWLTKLDYYNGLEGLLNEGCKVWADEASRELYLSILKFRLSGDYTVLPQPDTGNQYFPPDVPAWQSPIRFMDCGAFNGDTVAQLMHLNRPIEALAAFEPDQANFVKLARFVRSNRATLPDNVALWPCGVYSVTEQMRFAAGAGQGSHISTSGDTVIQCVALDDAVPYFRPNLIKMDIEGAEDAALLGARQIINNYRPGMAISLYHKPAHLWQIPLMLNSWQCGYKFYLRSHCYTGFELVLYAIPS